MNYKNIAVPMLEEVYEYYRDFVKNDSEYVSIWLDYDLPVWSSMTDNTKQAAIEYVYKNRNDIELHSGEVESWVQATAYFMLKKFWEEVVEGCGGFFDDLDFMMEEDILQNKYIQEALGISSTFNNNF
jgi:hypothetical protein